VTRPAALGLVQVPNGCSAWRVCWPFEALRRAGYPAAWQWLGTPEAAAQVEYADLVVNQRACWNPGEEGTAYAWRDFLHAHGKALVYEADDDLFSPAIIDRIRRTGDAEVNRKSDAELEAGRQASLFALRLADGVTASTEHLAAVCRGYTPAPVRVVPNAIDVERFRRGMGTPDPDRPLTIGWAGGNRPDSDARQLARAWTAIARRYPAVRFLVGYHRLGALCDAVPPDRLDYVGPQTLARYPATIARIDIGCCPLEPEPFNLSKSPIKAFEYGLAGAAVVASPVVYDRVIDGARNGLLAETAAEWEAALSILVEDADRRRELAGRLQQDVLDRHSLEHNLGNWPRAWAEIRDGFVRRSLESPPSLASQQLQSGAGR
jgi:glycosyltransferase involved in cell wall biosynthesis